jgi:hypothetical protein
MGTHGSTYPHPASCSRASPTFPISTFTACRIETGRHGLASARSHASHISPSSKTPRQWPSGTARSRNVRSSRYSSFYPTLPLPSRYLPRTSQLAPIRVSSTFVWRIISSTGSAVHAGARITGPEQTQWSMPGGALRPNPNVRDFSPLVLVLG